MVNLAAPFAVDFNGNLIDSRGICIATASSDAAPIEKVALCCSLHDDLIRACKEGLKLGEIAVRLGLDFDEETTEEIVLNHTGLSVIRSVLRKAGEL